MTDALMAALATDQSITRKIQRRDWRQSCEQSRYFVGSVLVKLSAPSANRPHCAKYCGHRWSCGGMTTAEQYNEKKIVSVKGDFHLLQQIQHTQNKNAKQNRNMIQDLIVPLFEGTNVAMLDYIKQNLFKVD
jgi:hypothetical protein